ncbi:TetR family transcriptional regulator [Sphaerisporangium rufum]|uniref:TetR family transcriptional regulator n=1 Tax=Sphaerisporangium rufum TaxID=1381558 RepID=A0A919R4H6_9ACTN|nr:TetR/AcrR family transcriptional regulator C-terminal domain-containing protein [Sphaerisporangium rufum]GII78175.1 TetR family transcriptional regulator [Sphaerisporangium rufum]
MPPKPRFQSVWTREPAPAKRVRDQPALSRDQIVREAMALLDQEGMDALSMRKLGARLGSGATSLYWHVANKDELLELVLDQVYAEAWTGGLAADGWRDTVAVLAYGLRGAMLKHPWVVTLIGSMPSLGPNAMAAVDTLVRTLSTAGFSPEELDYAVAAVMSYTIGATTPEASWINSRGRQEYGMDDWVESMKPQVRVAAAAYPELLARFEAHAPDDLDRSRQLSFDFGLMALLDGLDARLHGR